MKLSEIKYLNESKFISDPHEIRAWLKTNLSYNSFYELQWEINEDGFSIDCDDFVLRKGTVEKLPIKLGKVSGALDVANNLLSSFDGFPEEISKYLDLSDNKFTSLAGISDIIKKMPANRSTIYCSGNKITHSVLGLVMIEGLKRADDFAYENMVEEIVSKYIGNPDLIYDCQEELFRKGFEEYAQL